MATTIHPTAIVDSKAELADGVTVGPYVIIEGGVKIGSGTKIWQQAYIAANTTIGTNNQIHPGAVIGHMPQDLNWSGGVSNTVIGNDNVIREYVQIHRGSKVGATTKIGNNCYLMAGAHVAHDCTIGDKVIMANHVLLAGYVEIGDGAFLSGGALVHQFTRVGKLCILQGKSACGMHVPPYMLVAGINEVHGLNIVGMKRWPGLTAEAKQAIKEVHRLLYRSNLSPQEAIEQLGKQPVLPEVQEMIRFVKQVLADVAPYRRGLCPAPRSYSSRS